jgi:ATP-dependent protease Clp ATPase subunit
MNNREELNALLHDVEPEDLIIRPDPEFVGGLPVVAVLTS